MGLGAALVIGGAGALAGHGGVVGAVLIGRVTGGMVRGCSSSVHFHETHAPDY